MLRRYLLLMRMGLPVAVGELQAAAEAPSLQDDGLAAVQGALELGRKPFQVRFMFKR